MQDLLSIDDHPDIYIYAVGIEAAPFLKDDSRLNMWKTELNERLEQLNLASDIEQFSGTMQRQYRVLGG